MIKILFQILIDRLYSHAEGWTAFVGFLFVFMKIDWGDKMATFFISVSGALISALLANILKQAKISEWIIRKAKKEYRKFKNRQNGKT